MQYIYHIQTEMRLKRVKESKQIVTLGTSDYVPIIMIIYKFTNRESHLVIYIRSHSKSYIMKIKINGFQQLQMNLSNSTNNNILQN